jgi:hypothetical protein
MMRALALLSCLTLAACELPPVDPEMAARECEGRAQAAQGPTGRVTFGVNSTTGRFTSAEVGVSSDFLRGLDPVQVYERCVFERTGALPVRPPVLRNL